METYYVLLTYLGYAAMAGLLLGALRASDQPAVTLLTAAGAFIALGLVVQGGLISPQPRYHAKVAWIAWLVVAAVAHQLALSALDREAAASGSVRRPGERGA